MDDFGLVDVLAIGKMLAVSINQFHLHRYAIADPGDGLDDVVPIVAQGLSQLTDGSGQRGFDDVKAGPDVIEEVVLRDDVARSQE